MERNSFIFYASFFEAIKELPNDNQLKVYQAITNFALNGIDPTDLNGIEKAVFILVKPQIIANNKRYENGCNGGRPKKEEKVKIKSHNKTIGFVNKKPNNNQTITKVKPNENDNENDNDNVNDNVINNKRENNIKEKSLAVVETTALTPQVEVFNYFAKLYKSETNIDYLGKGIDYINLAKLIKKYGKALVINKINWLLVGCKHRVFFFSKGMTDFNISTLTAQWDRILPKLTDEQKKEQDKLKAEAEKKKKLYEALEKQGIVLEEKGNKGGLNVVSR